jgi:hypothetical protein
VTPDVALAMPMARVLFILDQAAVFAKETKRK